MSALYGAHAQSYLDAGWPCVMPIPAGQKQPPPAGFTGNDHPDTDQATVDGWIVSRANSSIALRVAPNVVGIDVDHYDKPKVLADGTLEIVKKRGADDLARCEADWGPLPATWRSSARDLPSGIRFFRVPPGVKFRKGVGDMDVIQRTHRYIMVAPSVHPDTGAVYAWYDPNGEPSGIPRIEDLPELPAAWVARLSEKVSQGSAPKAATGAAATMLAAIEADTRPMCSAMEIAVNRAVAQLNAANSGSRHDTAMARTMRIIGLAAGGHTGGGAGLARTRDAWESVTAGEGREYEFDSLIAGAAAQAAGAVALSQPRELDPCDGAAGTGIEVVTDPGEGQRRAVLVVEGLDDARMCGEYAGGSTVVLGLAGRESWRGVDGVPVPELRVVSGLPVTVLFGPDVATDLVTWRAAEDLGGSVAAKGATGAMFTQPPGTRGVRVTTYLNSLTEAERVGELEHMRVTGAISVPFKPKPKAARKLGAEDTEELPPTDDTSLGTSWADDNSDRFRVLSSDKTWMIYRTGRWSVDGAELAVGHALMEFLSEAAGPLQAIRSRSGDPDERDKYQRAIDAILSARKRQAVASTAMTYAPMHILRDELDQHPRKFCVANGVLDLQTLEVTPHDPDLMLTTGSDVAYDPAAQCPTFDQFFAEVLPDEDVRNYLLRVFAMAMWGEVIEQILPVLIGDGRNGKGVLIKIMQAVFGSHAQAINAKALLKRKFDAHDVEVAQLAGKRLAVAEETGQNSEWDVSRINDWTGNVRLSGRFMHGNPFNFEPSHTLVMVTNHRPNVGQGETAFWARYKEVPFTQSFEGRENPNLARTILGGELSGVLNRLIEAGRSYRVHGLAEPHAVSAAVAEAKVDADHLFRYVAEHIAVTHDHELDRITNPDLYDSVGKWWSQNVPRETPPSNRVFARQMRMTLGFAPGTSNPKILGQGKDARRTWTGIRWLNGGAPDGGLKPLERSTGAEGIIGSTADVPNPMTVRVGGYSPERTIGDPKKPTADVEDRTADDTADDVDLETGVVAGEETTTADTADTADNLRGMETTQEKGGVKEDHLVENHDPQGVEAHTSPLYSPAIARDRQYLQNGSIGVPTNGVVVLDLETDSADHLHDHPEPEKFVRLVGYSTGAEAVVETSAATVIDLVCSSQLVIGSNHVAYDLPALARIDRSVDVLALARAGRLLDTMITDSVLNPIKSDLGYNAVGMAARHFKVDESAKRFGVPGKTLDLKKHVKEHYDGDFDAIAWETDEILNEYLVGDVAASLGVGAMLKAQLDRESQRVQDYVRREHRVHAIASQMSVSGFLADVPLLHQRHTEAKERRAELQARLVAEFDIPTTLASGKPAKNITATKEGKEAIKNALIGLGVQPYDIPMTSPTERNPQGQPSFGGENVKKLAQAYAEQPNADKISDLCEIIGDSWGVRAVYGTAVEYLRTDDRVHPQVATFQASGRWSVTKPGLTVFGKRGIGRNGLPRVTERAVFRAAEGNVLMSIDLSQVDSRAIAVHSQDQGYMALFGPGLDAHQLVAEMVWGETEYATNPKYYRDQVKAITHGLPYGMGIDKLVAHTGVARDVAERVVTTMNQRFPRLQQWKDEIREEAKSGRFLDNGFGRMMRPDPQRAYTQGPALMGQGTARDLMMECLLRVDDCDAQYGTEIIRMLRAQIHDEAIWELPADQADTYADIIEQCFNFEWSPETGVQPVGTGGTCIRLMAEVDRDKTTGKRKFGRSWAECY